MEPNQHDIEWCTAIRDAYAESQEQLVKENAKLRATLQHYACQGCQVEQRYFCYQYLACKVLAEVRAGNTEINRLEREEDAEPS